MPPSNPQPATRKFSGKRSIILPLLAAVAAIIGVASLTHKLIDGDWQPTEAKVTATEIHRTRPGNLAWSLMVAAAYDVDGTKYRYRWLDVFHHQEKEVTEAEQAKWPAGKSFTLYYNPENPDRPSLASDGGREAATVVAALMTPMALVLLWMIYMMTRRQPDDTPTA